MEIKRGTESGSNRGACILLWTITNCVLIPYLSLCGGRAPATSAGEWRGNQLLLFSSCDPERSRYQTVLFSVGSSPVSAQMIHLSRFTSAGIVTACSVQDRFEFDGCCCHLRAFMSLFLRSLWRSCPSRLLRMLFGSYERELHVFISYKRAILRHNVALFWKISQRAP